MSGSPRPKWITVITGSKLAGTYRIAALTISAQVRAMLLGLRRCMAAPQRGQCAVARAGSGGIRASWSQL